MVQHVGGLNMAEAVAHGPSHARSPPQLLGSKDKSRLKSRQQQASIMPSNGIQNLRGAPAKPDSGKIPSNLGKLQMLKPARDLIGVSSTAVKEILSPDGATFVNNHSSLNPMAVSASAPSRIPENTQVCAVPVRKTSELSSYLEKNINLHILRDEMTSLTF
ncbi:hypothetical protein SAY87_000168 [Trapa incisa]|uniref:Uncharacterized protein n=1 Tax=Trapa incisa TaxID=236973 RepID=A0AAN7GT25_9MYRT|nr:hypothetical protein SAY87_000168 [Trapa incisa]